jgi:cytochrome c-type biogenesis protein CcmH/NrfF
MAYRRTVTFLIIILLSSTLIACSSSTPTTTSEPPSSTISSAPSTSTLDGATLVQQRCTVCHSLSRIESSHHSATEWQTIVDSMIQRGAQLTPEEETAVLNYLAATYGP